MFKSTKREASVGKRRPQDIQSTQNQAITPRIDEQNCLVVDLTYRCNARCHYCQWGSSETPGRVDLPDAHILIPHESLRALQTQRVVFSGGEPLLRQDLAEIISWYRRAQIESIVLITNGLRLSPERLESLVDAGLTGLTFSIDSLDDQIANATRQYTPGQCATIRKHFAYVTSIKAAEGLEVGVNTVLSKANIIQENFLGLLQMCREHPLDWIKFNLLFDDGFVGSNAPHLIPDQSDAPKLNKLGLAFASACPIPTNPASFWDAASKLLSGRKLLGASCGLDSRQAIAIRGALKFCFWIDEPAFGGAGDMLSSLDVEEAQQKFGQLKKHCNTGAHCFCLQQLSHSWDVSDE